MNSHVNRFIGVQVNRYRYEVVLKVQIEQMYGSGVNECIDV